MELENLTQSWDESNTGSYPEPYEFSPYPNAILIYDPF
jgi:hypothetical protein